MGRGKVYDCADVNDIIQMLNQAARLQASRSPPLAVSLENPKWIPAVGQSDDRRAERTAETSGQVRSGCQFVVCCPGVYSNLFVHFIKRRGVHFFVSNDT